LRELLGGDRVRIGDLLALGQGDTQEDVSEGQEVLLHDLIERCCGHLAEVEELACPVDLVEVGLLGSERAVATVCHRRLLGDRGLLHERLERRLRARRVERFEGIHGLVLGHGGLGEERDDHQCRGQCQHHLSRHGYLLGA
jgi:hypothetical protein